MPERRCLTDFEGVVTWSAGGLGGAAGFVSAIALGVTPPANHVTQETQAYYRSHPQEYPSSGEVGILVAAPIVTALIAGVAVRNLLSRSSIPLDERI